MPIDWTRLATPLPILVASSAAWLWSGHHYVSASFAGFFALLLGIRWMLQILLAIKKSWAQL